MQEGLVYALLLHVCELAGEPAIEAFVHDAAGNVRFLVQDHLIPPLSQS
jgi:hypothetical protein